MRHLWVLVLAMVGTTGCLIPDRVVEDYLDADQDGERTAAAGGLDCDDADRNVHTQAEEVCGDGVDNDCDGQTDDADRTARWWQDLDGDGFGDALLPSTRCARPEGFSATADDCDDGSESVHPDAAERCGDGVDNNCRDGVDEGGELIPWFADRDGDGAGAGELVEVACAQPPETSRVDDDCDDGDPAVHPGAPDTYYDGVDSNCDGADDFDRDADGHRYDPSEPNTGDCDDENAGVHPTAVDAWYDGVDSNCDGLDDFDADQDGSVSAAFGGLDCNDDDVNVHPGAHDEPYDGIDADCDPSNDDDADGDGVTGGPGGADCDDGDGNNWLSCDSCVDLDGDGAYTGCDRYVSVSEDCDDTNDARHPDASEVFSDGVDQDCDGADLDLSHPDMVFVSVLGQDTPGCGAAQDPCRSIQAGAERAGIAGKTLIVAGGVYEAFTASVDVYGGFADDFTSRDVEAYPTRVVAPTGGASWAGVTLEGDGALTLDGVSVEASDSLRASVTGSRQMQPASCSAMFSWLSRRESRPQEWRSRGR